MTDTVSTRHKNQRCRENLRNKIGTKLNARDGFAYAITAIHGPTTPRSYKCFVKKHRLFCEKTPTQNRKSTPVRFSTNIFSYFGKSPADFHVHGTKQSSYLVQNEAIDTRGRLISSSNSLSAVLAPLSALALPYVARLPCQSYGVPPIRQECPHAHVT